MSRSKLVLGSLVVFTAAAGAYVACDVDEPNTDRTADLTVVVHTDHEFPIRDNPSMRPTSILVVVAGMSLHEYGGEWLDMRSYATLNLLAPEEAVPKLLSQGHIPDGMYDQLRLNITYAAVQVDRKWYPLEIPSEDQSGFKIHTTFCMVDGEPVTLDVEWNIDESLHHNEQRGYWLTPSLEVHSMPTCTNDKVAKAGPSRAPS